MKNIYNIEKSKQINKLLGGLLNRSGSAENNMCFQESFQQKNHFIKVGDGEILWSVFLSYILGVMFSPESRITIVRGSNSFKEYRVWIRGTGRLKKLCDYLRILEKESCKPYRKYFWFDGLENIILDLFNTYPEIIYNKKNEGTKGIYEASFNQKEVDLVIIFLRSKLSSIFNEDAFMLGNRLNTFDGLFSQELDKTFGAIQFAEKITNNYSCSGFSDSMKMEIALEQEMKPVILLEHEPFEVCFESRARLSSYIKKNQDNTVKKQLSADAHKIKEHLTDEEIRNLCDFDVEADHVIDKNILIDANLNPNIKCNGILVSSYFNQKIKPKMNVNRYREDWKSETKSHIRSVFASYMTTNVDLDFFASNMYELAGYIRDCAKTETSAICRARQDFLLETLNAELSSLERNRHALKQRTATKKVKFSLVNNIFDS